jgi:virginiamycin B lyase
MKFIFLVALLFPFSIIAQSINPAKENINKILYKAIALPEAPDFIAVDGDDAWVIDDNHNRIQKVAADSSMPLLTVNIPGACAAPVAGFNALWVMSCKEKKLYKIDNNTGKVIEKIFTGIADDNGEMSLAAGDGSVWLLSDSSGILNRINPATNKVEAKIIVMPHSYCAAFGFNAVWITNTNDNSVQRIDVKTNSVTATIPVGKKPRFLAVGEDGIWTLNQGDGSVTRINPASNKVIATIDTEAMNHGGDIAAGAGKIWIVSINPERPLQTINPADNMVETIYKYEAPDGKKIKADGAVRVSAKYIWMSDYYGKIVRALKR